MPGSRSVTITAVPLDKLDTKDLIVLKKQSCNSPERRSWTQALVSFQKYMPPPLPYFKVNIYPFFFAYLWSFCWPYYIVTLPKYFSFRLPPLNIPTGRPSDELDKNSQRMWFSENLSHWNGYSHFRSGLNWFRKYKKVLWKSNVSNLELNIFL
jgi:hypothetical protein